jgi:RNA polymerase sigma-70 factor (ECF subfamily)
VASDAVDTATHVDTAELDVGALFAAHAPFLANVVQRLTGPGAHVDDIVQDVFIIAHKKRAELARHPEVRAWLYRVTVHRVQQHRRSFARFFRALTAVKHEPCATCADATEGVERREHGARIRACVLALPFACREAFVLFDLEGLDTKTVARMLAIPEGTVASRVSLARKKFRELWVAQEDA